MYTSIVTQTPLLGYKYQHEVTMNDDSNWLAAVYITPLNYLIQCTVVFLS